MTEPHPILALADLFRRQEKGPRDVFTGTVSGGGVMRGIMRYALNKPIKSSVELSGKDAHILWKLSAKSYFRPARKIKGKRLFWRKSSPKFGIFCDFYGNVWPRSGENPTTG